MIPSVTHCNDGSRWNRQSNQKGSKHCEVVEFCQNVRLFRPASPLSVLSARTTSLTRQPVLSALRWGVNDFRQRRRLVGSAIQWAEPMILLMRWYRYFDALCTVCACLLWRIVAATTRPASRPAESLLAQSAEGDTRQAQPAGRRRGGTRLDWLSPEIGDGRRWTTQDDIKSGVLSPAAQLLSVAERWTVKIDPGVRQKRWPERSRCGERVFQPWSEEKRELVHSSIRRA